ncbi:MAG: DUF4058 family protein [Chitinophagaceae bacterium]|nr:DUF4058 family protein [Anaerolineae bacterium]
MNGELYPEAYDTLLERGPFPNQIDPWSEIDGYFHPLHASIIDQLLGQIQRPLRQLGYIAGKETSLQIAEGIKPDLHIEQSGKPKAPSLGWTYALAAEEILAEVGTEVDNYPEFWALHIYEAATSNLVTIIEVISPSNKTETNITQIRQRRARLVYEKGINFVEIDLTRSVKHLLESSDLTYYAYHAAVYLPDALPRLIGVEYGDAFSRIAVPLHQQVVGIEVQAAYDAAYRLNATAIHLSDDDHYKSEHLPFPSKLTDAQRQAALATVATWKAQLAQLR